jgi:hypothetical protein
VRLVLVLIACWFTMSTCRAELPTLEAIDALHADATARIAAGRFDSLLAEADKYLKTQERFGDGRWKLAILLGGMRRGFAQVASSPADWQSTEAALRALAARHPESPNAWLFLAIQAHSHAWAQRGQGYADSVGNDADAAFRRDLGQARTLLDAHQAPANPAWYALRLNVGGALGESRASLDTLFATAIKRQPDYLQTWQARENYLEPKWGGRVEDVIALAGLGGRTVSAGEGRGMMVEVLAAALDCNCNALMNHPGIDWAAVRASMDDVLQRYPDDVNAQRYFFIACEHGDKGLAQHLLPSVTAPPSPTLIGANARVFELCRSWAQGRIPQFAMRDHDTGQVRIVK